MFMAWAHVAELPQAVVCRYQTPGVKAPVETALYPAAFDCAGGRQ